MPRREGVATHYIAGPPPGGAPRGSFLHPLPELSSALCYCPPLLQEISCTQGAGALTGEARPVHACTGRASLVRAPAPWLQEKRLVYLPVDTPTAFPASKSFPGGTYNLSG